jgi:hypothetical protein
MFNATAQTHNATAQTKKPRQVGSRLAWILNQLKLADRSE